MNHVSTKLLFLGIFINLYVTPANATGGYTGKRYNVQVASAYRTTGSLMGGRPTITAATLPKTMLPNSQVPNASPIISQPITFVTPAIIPSGSQTSTPPVQILPVPPTTLPGQAQANDAPALQDFLLTPKSLLETAKAYNDTNFLQQVNPYYFQNRTDDRVIATIPNEDQGILYLASLENMLTDGQDANNINSIYNQVTDNALKEQEMSQQLPLDLYDELKQIATDTTNYRITSFITSNTTPFRAYALNREESSYQEGSYGISAGEGGINDGSTGLWVRGLYGEIKQGQTSGHIGFRGKTKGGTMGADYAVTDNTIIGLSYTRLHADFKYSYGQGNKVDTISDIVSLYGIHTINPRLTLHGLLSIGRIKAKQTTNHLIALNTYKAATSKSKVHTYSAETALNYKVPIKEQGYLIPNIGVRFSKNYHGGYSEWGTGIYNLSASSKRHTTLAIIGGIKVGMERQISDNLSIMPAAHFEIDHYAFNKASQAKIKMQWANSSLNDSTVAIKTVKTGYNIGATLLTKYKTLEIFPAYNAHLRGKYVSHQFSLRLKALL